MKLTSRRAPGSFDDAMQAIEAEADGETRSGLPAVSILAPLADVAPPEDGDFCPASWHGPFGYEPPADMPAREEIRNSPPALASLIGEVAAELDLSRASTPEALHQLRREFMWRNHPDRRRELSAQWSNARVAIANMLIDQALRERSAGRRAPA
jgi:hypothetical protein